LILIKSLLALPEINFVSTIQIKTNSKVKYFFFNVNTHRLLKVRKTTTKHFSNRHLWSFWGVFQLFCT